MKMLFNTHKHIVAMALFSIAGCGGGGSSSTPVAGTGTSVAARTAIIAPGDVDCPNGGILVETGIDENANGVLDATEVDTSKKVCNGLNTLVDIKPEPVSINCPSGGIRIDAGIDTNTDGILDTNEITQTSFVCATASGSTGWQVASLIEFDNSDSAEPPDVMVDSAGNAVAVWSQFIAAGVRTDIWSNRYEVGKGWGTAELLETDDAGFTYDPRVAVQSNGNAVAVWAQSDGSRTDIMSNRYVSGSAWDTAELIETDNTGNTTQPQVSIDANGNAIAVWVQNDGMRNNIIANRYVSGSVWGSAELIETNNAGDGSKPQVSVQPNGNALAVWQQSDGSRTNIWSNNYIVGTGWGTAELIESDNTDNAIDPQVSVDTNGNAMAVWLQSDGAVFNVWSNRYENGSWGSAELVETGDALESIQPQITIDTSGNTLAVWSKSNGSLFNLMSNRYTAGTGWGTPELVETNNSGSVLAPQISSDSVGNAVAVWYQSDGIRNNIWSNRYVVGNGWGVAELVELDDVGTSLNPQVSVDNSGNAMAVWLQDDGAFTFSVMSNRRLVQ